MAINHNHHGRDGSDPDLCDVCYWRKRAKNNQILSDYIIETGLKSLSTEWVLWALKQASKPYNLNPEWLSASHVLSDDTEPLKVPHEFILLKNLVSAYEREVNPASKWQDTALTEEEFNEQTKAYREAKEY